jgi:hypothetical protein
LLLLLLCCCCAVRVRADAAAAAASGEPETVLLVMLGGITFSEVRNVLLALQQWLFQQLAQGQQLRCCAGSAEITALNSTAAQRCSAFAKSLQAHNPVHAGLVSPAAAAHQLADNLSLHV